jgi:mRNA-degrading endonuclease RelE of RelBE toxin-antitoxin system
LESSLFTKEVYRHLTEESYFALQDFLLEYPTEGDLIPGSGGPRKIRWKVEGRGKRGGVRIIYYFADAKGHIYLLDIYSKTAKVDLTPDEIQKLRSLIEEWFNE